MDLTQFAGKGPGEVVAALKADGWKLLGDGAGAWCFGKPKHDRVIKVVCGDPGQREAITTFEAYPDVDAFPRVYGRADLTRDAFVVEMERLRKQPYNNDEYHDNRRRVHTWAQLGRMFGDDARTALEAAADHLEGCGLDLHADNIMLRKGAIPVIVDPFHIGSDHASHAEVRNALRA